MACRFLALSGVLFATALSVSGCGDDFEYAPGVGPEGSAVGGVCDSHGDCDDVCMNDDNYPRMCTYRCQGDADCPTGTICIEDNDGMCAISCAGQADCEPMGPGWRCDDRDRAGDNGEGFVCRMP